MIECRARFTGGWRMYTFSAECGVGIVGIVQYAAGSESIAVLEPHAAGVHPRLLPGQFIIRFRLQSIQIIIKIIIKLFILKLAPSSTSIPHFKVR